MGLRIGIGGGGAGGRSSDSLFYLKNVGTGDATIGFVKNAADAPTVKLEKSADGKTWESWGSSSTTALTATVAPGEKLYVRGDNNGSFYTYSSGDKYNKFTVSGNNAAIEARGDVRQLIDKNHTELLGDGNPLDYLFYNCDKLVLAILVGFSKISNSIYQLCSNLAVAPISKKVTHIISNAYSDCGIRNIFIPKNVVTIGNKFNGCKNIESISVDSENRIFDSREDCNAIINRFTKKLVRGCKNTIIPNTVTSLGESCFRYSYDNESIYIPDSVTAIEGYALANCSQLHTISIGAGVTEFYQYCIHSTSITNIYYRGTLEQWLKNVNGSNFKLVNAGHLYIGGEELLHLDTQGLDVSNIRPYAFINSGIVDAVVRGNIIDIEDYAFSNCSSLMSVVFYDTAKPQFINIGAFISCTSLSSVTLANTLEKIGDLAFIDNGSLESITIPASVERIGDSAFMNCLLLENVTCLAAVPPSIEGSTFENAGKNTTSGHINIYVPAASVDAYKEAGGWIAYKDYILPITQ